MPRQLPVVLIGVLVFALIAVGGVADQYRTSVTESQPQQTVENETYTVNAGATVVLNESKRDVVYNRSVEVFQNGSEYDSDGNYTWNAGNGTLSIPAGTGLSDGNTSNITYRYHEPSGSQQVARDVTLLPFDVLGESIGIVVGAALVLGAIVLLGRQR